MKLLVLKRIVCFILKWFYITRLSENAFFLENTINSQSVRISKNFFMKFNGDSLRTILNQFIVLERTSYMAWLYPWKQNRRFLHVLWFDARVEHMCRIWKHESTRDDIFRWLSARADSLISNNGEAVVFTMRKEVAYFAFHSELRIYRSLDHE